jgi:hypothetical protein
MEEERAKESMAGVEVNFEFLDGEICHSEAPKCLQSAWGHKRGRSPLYNIIDWDLHEL